jgi:thioesterase domain-containing protein
MKLNRDKPAEAWDSLVAIKTTGKKPPLFLIHSSGLHILVFKSLSKYFDKDQPLYGIQAIGLSNNTAVPERLEDIAAHYLSEILSVNPDGPYCIAGYSHGGFFAYEIARQLKKAKKEVQFLGVIDTYTGDIVKPTNKSVKIAQKIIRQFNKVPFLINSFIKHPKDAFDYQTLSLKRRFPRFFKPESNPEKDNRSPREKEISNVYNNAVHNYKLEPFDIEVSLFNVDKRLYFIDDPKYLGWDKFALKGVKIYKTSGDHKTFLYPPNDEKFSKIIQQALDS